MKNRQPLVFKKISEFDVPLVFSWFEQSQSYNYQTEKELATEYLAEQESVQRYVVCSSGRPFGYIQSLEVRPDHTYGLYRHPTGKTVCIELLIGERDFLRKGYSFEMLTQFIHFLRRGISRVIVDPVVGTASIRLLQKYGFVLMGEASSKQGKHQVLAIDVRNTVRALILNESKQLLLMKMKDDSTADSARIDGHYWCTIGGKIEKNEESIEALTREIREETGLQEFTVGKLAFYGEHTLLVRQFPVRFFENFYFVYSTDSILHQENLTESERAIFRDIRWWNISDLLTTKELFYPRCLAVELGRVLKRGKMPKQIPL